MHWNEVSQFLLSPLLLQEAAASIHCLSRAQRLKLRSSFSKERTTRYSGSYRAFDPFPRPVVIQATGIQ